MISSEYHRQYVVMWYHGIAEGCETHLDNHAGALGIFVRFLTTKYIT